MRLWHEALIPYLPRQQLFGLHREVCALRGLGWGKPHVIVDYVFDHPYAWLVAYHRRVIKEITERGYKVDSKWWDALYRGKNTPSMSWAMFISGEYDFLHEASASKIVYPEHDEAYLQECLYNLEYKGIHIDMEEKDE